MEYMLDVEDIRALLPHRYPMLMVDRVLELVPGERVVALKNVTVNEPYFTGHFPDQAVMPGVMLLEAMAQVAGLIMLSVPKHAGKLAYIGTIKRAKFNKPVVPGDTLIINAQVGKVRGDIGEANMIATVEGTQVARCTMMFAMMLPTPNKVHERLNLGRLKGE